MGKLATDCLGQEPAEQNRNRGFDPSRESETRAYDIMLLHPTAEEYDPTRKWNVVIVDEAIPARLGGRDPDAVGWKRAEHGVGCARDDFELRVQELTSELAEAKARLLSEITDRKRTEDALRDRMHKLEFFAYSVVHDLKNPAIGIRGFARLLKEQYGSALDEKARKYCDLIMGASEHLVALVEDLNSYVAAKESPLRIEKINIKGIFQTIKEEFSGLINSRYITWLEPESAPEFMADHSALLRVFRNIVDNSLKYGGEGLSEIRIGYRESAEHHVFSFLDDGLGIKRGDSKRIFEPFHRGSRSKSCPGTGLGLAIVKEIAERHGGMVWLEGSRQKGTSFCVSISKRLKPGSQSDNDGNVSEGSGSSQALYPEDRPRTAEILKQAVESRTIYDAEYRLRRFDGEYRDVPARRLPVVDKDGSIREREGNCTEIAERTRAEETMRRYALLSKHAREIILFISQDGRVLEANEAACAAYGYDRETILALTINDLRAPETKHQIPDPMEKAFREGDFFESRHMRKDGSVFPVEVSSRGIEIGVERILLVSDITEKLTAQAEAMRASHLVSLGESAAGVAHEINNPLNGIINYAQILINECRPESLENDIGKRIVKEGARIADIVKSLLSFARGEGEDPRPARIDDILKESLVLTRAQLRKESIRLDVDLPDDLPEIKANFQQIQQVFLNIVNNARYALNDKYPARDEHKAIDIRGESVRIDAREYVRITFFDRGVGIPADKISMITKPFFSTKPLGKGTGLGLTITHKIMTEHGGRLTFESVEGEFTRVIIDFPVKGAQ